MDPKPKRKSLISKILVELRRVGQLRLHEHEAERVHAVRGCRDWVRVFLYLIYDIIESSSFIVSHLIVLFQLSPRSSCNWERTRWYRTTWATRSSRRACGGATSCRAASRALWVARAPRRSTGSKWSCRSVQCSAVQCNDCTLLISTYLHYNRYSI